VLGDNPERRKQLPNVHRVFSLCGRWMLGTYQDCHPIIWQSYLDEFVFVNRRRLRMLGCSSSVARARFHGPPTYATLRTTPYPSAA